MGTPSDGSGRIWVRCNCNEKCNYLGVVVNGVTKAAERGTDYRIHKRLFAGRAGGHL
ncbi:hypothetical protein KC8_02190 [Sphingomonas sp. KC8]|nr:hypothetical protein KC8_02190 [Sphingomonas sp. KC8]